MTTIVDHHNRAASKQSQKGFTLVEIIVTLILISITSVVMFPVLRSNLTQSAVPVRRLDSQYLLIQEMDRLTGLYRNEIENETLIITNFEANPVGTSTYVDSAKTGMVTLTGMTYGSTASPNILQVTLVDGDLSLVSFFTQ